MKIAVFHSYLDNIGGAEIVTLTLARELNADIFTTNIDKEKILKMGFKQDNIFSIGKIPLNAPFRHQLALYKFRKLNLKKKYDFYIICGDWAMSAAVNNKPNLWYVHSPLNELWAFKDYIKNTILAWWQKPLFEIWVFLNRYLTKKYSKHVKIWVTNSKNTQERVEKYYRKQSTVINPPVETKEYNFKENKNYWLSVNRLVKAKRINTQLGAFAKMENENLIIVASYEKGSRQFENEKKQLSLKIPKNVSIKNWVSKEELLNLYSGCKGFITTSKDEDFGMAVVEAMAAGKPVIAPNEGGYKESVINGKTGILIDEIDENKLVKAIELLGQEVKENPLKYKTACQEQAKKFDTEIFVKKIREEIRNNLKQNENRNIS